MALAKAIPKYSDPGGGAPGLLDGALGLFKSMSEKESSHAFGRESGESDLSLLLTLVVSRMSSASNVESAVNFERALSDYSLLKSIEDPKHLTTATRLMLRHKHIFFERETARNWDGLGEEARKKITEVAAPNVRAAWLLCMLVARELFNGDHTLSPREALCLGLVDEVPGATEFQSRRQILKEAAEKRAADQPPAVVVRRLKRRTFR